MPGAYETYSRGLMPKRLQAEGLWARAPTTEGLGGVRRARGAGRRQAQWPFSAFPPEPHASTAAPENRSKDRARGGLWFLGAGIRGGCPPLSLLLSGRKGLSSKPPSFRRPPRKGGTEFRVQEDRGSQTYRSPPTQSASRPGQEEKDRVPASLPFSGLLSRALGKAPVKRPEPRHPIHPPSRHAQPANQPAREGTGAGEESFRMQGGCKRKASKRKK